ncbi:MAG: helicase-exonuclease AddAB subunit AddA [Caldicoprobacterales bacterium]|jgi:ATP-dependent helicase/nuclease subunit A|nr:helicase-exonuclease AddAB subunit AddA [Clostridiales bacterium]
MPKWTVQQQAAIDARECNLLVAAAAGSGKTAVLVERILQLILKDGVDIDRLLVVTFTNAAAGEMRERISSALTKAIDEGGQNDKHLRQQLNLLSKASISTIHSFCISVIRKYFHVINLDPGFRIGDETECSLIKLEAIEDLFEEQYEEGSQTFLGLVERFGGSKQDTALQDLVIRLHAFIQSKPFPRQWLVERVQDFAGDAGQLENSPWCRALLSTIQMEILGIMDSLKEALSLCSRPGGPFPYQTNLFDDIGQMEEILRLAAGNDLKACSSAYEQVKFTTLKRCPKDVNEDLKQRVRDLREKAKKGWRKLGGGLLASGLDQSIEQLHELHPYMLCLSNLVFKFDEEFRRQKQEKGIVDFNDLEHYTLEILQHEQVAQELKQKYEYIFIDEYQDSNLVQETILSYVSRGGNLFMVGDVKQSIYRFRLADPTIFLDKYSSFLTGEDAGNRRVDLNRNFRSRPNILEGVNYLFENIMSSSFGELDYDDKAALYPGLETPPEQESELEFHLIEKTADEEEMDAETENLSDLEVEASIAAQRIQQLVGTEIYDAKQGAYRKADYRDMVVLLRSTKNRATVFQEVFAAWGIPVYADINTGYFEALEVKIIIALLKLIDNKLQDIPLLTVMRSPIGGFDADDLIQIRTASKTRYFYQAAAEYAGSREDDLARRLKDFHGKIVDWQKTSRYLPMEDFIWKLYTESGYYDYAGAMPGGLQRQANLRILLEKARQFQQTSIKGLFQFIRFIDKLQGSSGDMGAAKTLGENENVLRIMSIHKSKGLEFPVVVVAGLGKQFNFSDINSSVLFHKDLGLGPKYVNPDTRQTCETIARSALKQVIRLEGLSEEMRILYVALTRSKNRLILLGSAADLQKNAERWMKPISPYSLSKGKSFLDWIGPVLIRHPDCGELRGLLKEDSDLPLWNHTSSWKVQLHSPGEIGVFSRQAAQNRQEFLYRMQHPSETIHNFINQEKNIDTEFFVETGRDEDRLRSMIEKRFAWEYPFGYAVNIPSKLTVTEIRKLHGMRAVQLSDEGDTAVTYPVKEAPSFSARPGFLEGSKQFSAAEKGTIVHFILQHLELDRVASEQEVAKQVDEMVRCELLTQEEAQAADLTWIHAFFNSETGFRIRNADGVRREVPFNFRKKADELINHLQPNDDTLLIQGVIDCFFEEEGQWVLVDYKTDYVNSVQRLQELAQQYRVQMDLYTEALEQITGKPVKERILYFLSANQAINV